MSAHKHSLDRPLDPRIKQLEQECSGPILDAIRDEAITEIMLNPDGVLWVEDHIHGMRIYGNVSAEQAERIIRKVAGIKGMTANQDNPILECEFPLDQSRFEAILPSIVTAPSFTIRKKAKLIYTFADYIEKESLTLAQAEAIRAAIRDRKNILVCGGPGTGKTTFTNACIHELTQIVDHCERLLILEDVEELQCSAKNVLRMTTNLLLSIPIDLQKLVYVAMRSRPDRIIIGEVRDKAMLYLMKAWNTGCPGGIATIHANDTHSAIERCLSLAEEAGVVKPISLLLETIQVIVSVERDNKTMKRRIKNVSLLTGYDPKSATFLFKELA
jgi:P-type conjugative transfer ATPase TrbB